MPRLPRMIPFSTIVDTERSSEASALDGESQRHAPKRMARSRL